MSNLNGLASSGVFEAAAGPTNEPMTVVIGCGNPARSDDGVGIAVLYALKAKAGKSADAIRWIDAGTSGMDVMFQVRHARRVVIIDACNTRSEPGAVFHLPGREAYTPTEHGFSLHGLRWDHALYAGCKMFGDSFIDRVDVILIEAQGLGYGLELSPPVALAVDKAVAAIEQMLRP